MNKLYIFKKNTSSKLWIVPALMVAGSVVLSILLLSIDKNLNPAFVEHLLFISGFHSDSALTMLNTIAGSMITEGATVFSITIVALTLASMQFSPRVLGNFMHHRTTQVVLGAFLGLFVYCLIMFYAVNNGGKEFVPTFSLLFALVMAVFSIVILISFIYQISVSIQASHIASRVVRETFVVIDQLYPEQSTNSDKDDQAREKSFNIEKWHPIPVQEFGFIQYIDEKALFKLACAHNMAIKINRGCGSFVVINETIASISKADQLNQNIIAKINNCFGIGTFRTIEQDIAFGIWELVDMALKALSMAVNDTSTGVMCVNHITAIIARVAPRESISRIQCEGAELRLIASIPTFEMLLDQGFDQIRHNSNNNIAVIFRVLHGLDVIGKMTTDPKRRTAILRHVRLIAEIAEKTVIANDEMQKIKSMVDLVSSSFA